MAAKKKEGATLVIVESPAKARTISKFLGPDFQIEASVGHIRDLPANAAEVPPKYKKEGWARLGINIEEGFKPLYVVPKEKREHLKKLKEKVKAAAKVYLATDEDREGESISWHLVEELKPEVEYQRLVFHEITKEAIQHALSHPRAIDYNLVEAQETRRLMDRLYGYQVSPLLWKKIRPKLSAGRVQSVAVRLVIERERERIRFVATEHWSVEARFETPRGAAFDATLVEADGKRVATGKDFDPETGRLRADAADRLHLTEELARAIAARLEGKPVQVQSLEQKPYTERPAPPFTTSTLQQEASRRLGFTARRTMRAAQRLYENGYITYMRTDSTTLSAEALSGARTLIAQRFGKEHVPDSPRAYATKVKNAQEAHEAIRPAGARFRDPTEVGGDLGEDERRLYELIWRRTVASQMKDARGLRTTVQIGVAGHVFQAGGRIIEYPGFRLAYAELTDDEAAASAPRKGETEGDGDRVLPAMTQGEALTGREYRPEGHTTKPPPRLTEATLVRELEARGIGRPSTYATIIDTILEREYCFKKGSALVPTFTAFAVIQLMHGYLDYLVDYAFTARMEDDLDEISNGRDQRVAYLSRFYHGNDRPGLKEALTKVETMIDPRQVCTLSDFRLGNGPDGDPIEVRVGRFGPFLSCGEVSASLPDGLAPDELTREYALDLLAKAKEGPKSLGSDPATGLPVFVKIGRFGPYFQLGDAETLGDEKPKMASLLPGMSPETATLEEALAVLALPRKLGTAVVPDTGEEAEVVASNGRFGPYLKWGKETRSLPAGEDLLTIELPRALEILRQPKQHGRRTRSAPSVLRELGPHPKSGAAVKLLDGRYGPYVTDGEVNASLAKGEDPASLTMDRAVELLEARAARGPVKKKRGRRPAAKRKDA